MIDDRKPTLIAASRFAIWPIEETAFAGLALLLRASIFAQDAAADSWDFALPIERLYEAGMSVSDLRWLIAKGYSEHGQETSIYGDPHRSFRRGEGFYFDQSTCLVLTPTGIAFASQVMKDAFPEVIARPLRPDPMAHASNGLQHLVQARATNRSADAAWTPCWNPMRRELSVDGAIVKRFRVPAQNQELILCAFQEEGWPRQIFDPLPVNRHVDAHSRLHDTINRLNGCQTTPLVRFHGNGNGTGVSWELRPSKVSH